MTTLAHQIEPARCKTTLTFEQFSKLDDSDFKGMRAEEKFDGRRYLLQVRPNGAKFNYLTSRRVSVTTGQMVEKQDSMPVFRDLVFGPPDTVYDGEMLHPDGGSSHEAATAIANGTAVFRVFDIVRCAGQDSRNWPQEARRAALCVIPECAWPERICLTPQSKSPKRLLNAVRAQDGEGIILKADNAQYGDGWIKVVSVEFYDVVVTGYEMSTSEKYGAKGWIKGIKFGQWITAEKALKLKIPGTQIKGSFSNLKEGAWALVEIGQTSGFNEELREKVSKNPTKYMGAIMVLRAKGREKSGALRHPRFDSWHPDKNPKECTW